MGYVIKKTTYYNDNPQGIYYITKHFSSPNSVSDSNKKDAFSTYDDANQYMLEIINRDYPYRRQGFKFYYEILEVR